MNKKFSTLVASLLLAGAVGVNAQVITYDVTTGHPSQDYGGVAKNAADPRFGNTPYLASTVPTVTIKKLFNVDKGAEAQYFHLGIENGRYLLAMQWDETVKKYQLVFVDSNNASARAFVDEALWEVQAMYVGASKDLRFVLVNKASQLPLQVPNTSNYDATNGTTAPLYVEGKVITWSWSPVADNASGLKGKLVAAIDANNSVAITTSYARNPNATVKRADKQLTNDRASDFGMVATKIITNGTAANDNDILEFAAYEAQPVDLTASQINSMMTGTEEVAPVQFAMDPNEVVNSTYGNPLTANKLKAYEAEGTNWVYLSTKKEPEKKFESILYVDTAYHNASLDARYELKLNVGRINEDVVPREAYVVESELNITDKKLVKSVVAAMKEQAKFQLKYYPSDRKVLIQSKGYVYAEKTNTTPWWKTLVLAHKTELQTLNAVANTSFNTTHDVLDASELGATSSVIAKVKNVDWNDFTPAGNTEVDMVQPAFTKTSTNGHTGKYIWSSTTNNNATEWKFNLIKLTTLTTSPEHTELTVGFDSRDEDYDGIKTNIFIGAIDKKEAAYITSGFYYIQNANEVSTLLLKSGQWRYEDLAATNYTGTHFNSVKNAWIVESNQDEVEAPYVVYSEDKLVAIPSAQWYIKGEAGFYSITNRESAKSGSYTYLWKVKKDGAVVPNTYACLGTYADGTSYNDTIKIEPVALKMDKGEGYLNMSNAEAIQETNVFNFKYSALGAEALYVGKNAAGQLLVGSQEDALAFKVEKVKLTEKDTYTNLDKVYDKDSLIYGLDNLKRALYYVYVENVSSNTTEPTGKKTRTYVTLDGGAYKLVDVEVKVDENGYATPVEATVAANDPRMQFYVKNISNTENEFVFVDPFTLNSSNKLGVRAFVNQVTGILQPAGVVSQGASNVFDNSVFAFEKVTMYNYRDIRKEGAARDTVVFHKASNDKILLYEGHATGANIGLLDRVNDAQDPKNYAMFVDTANISDPAKPMFLLGLRNVDTDEHGSNIDEHNHHLYTTADYLMVLTDSAAVNNAYKDYQGKIRLGFVNAKHEGTKLSLTNSKKVFDLAKGMCPAVFAFRYVDSARETFYIETADTNGDRAWIKTINEVPVIVKNIQDAEVFNVKSTTDAPTANEAVEAAEVSVVATQGAIIVKGAAGKVVTVANILGQTIANQVAASDNVTIAAPAGVAVVTVDGEATKVVVK